MVILAALVASNLTLVKFEDRVPFFDMCPIYRQWQEEFNKRKQEVLDNKVEHLSYDEFVAIKQGNVVPHLESLCKKE